MKKLRRLLRRLRAKKDEVVARIKRVAKRLRRKRRRSHSIISRSSWGARAPKSRRALASTRDGVFIHHTVGGNPTTRSAEEAEMRAIQRFHMDTRGWADIAYSFVVARSGRIYEARGKGIEGAHTAGYNATSHAICAMGNYDDARPTDAQIAAMRWLRRKHLGAGSKPLRAHGSVAPTACPGKHLRARLNDL